MKQNLIDIGKIVGVHILLTIPVLLIYFLFR